MERISTHQFMILGAAVFMGGTFLDIAGDVTAVSGRDGWMTILPGSAVAIPYALMLLSLLEQYPQKNLIQITEIVLGKWIGKTVGLLYILISGYYSGLLLVMLGNMFRSITPLVPLWVFFAGGLLIVLYLLWSGVEVLARFAEIVFPLIVIAFLLNVAFAIPHFEAGELLPVMSEGVKPLLGGVLRIMPFTMTYILFLAGLLSFLPSSKQDLAQLKTGAWRAAFLVGILSMLITITQIMVFGPSETVRIKNGILVLEKVIEAGRTVAGVESLFMGVWLGALVIKTAAFLFMVLWGMKTVFNVNVQNARWGFLAAAVCLGIASAFPRGAQAAMEISLAQTYLIFPLALVWIPVLWGVAHWKKGKRVAFSEK